MGQAITLGTLARREAVLLSCLAAAAAAVGLAGPLHTYWLYVAGVAAAGAGALARVVIRVRQAQIEGKRERVGFDRRTRVSIMDVTRVDPTEIGVDAAAQTILGGNEVPSYLPREADEQLRAAVRSALSGTGRWIVVAVGRSKVGKSRALFEAVSHCANDAAIDLIAPVDGDALRSLITPGEAPRIVNGRRVLWLDDLEPFLNQSVTFQTLREWHASTPEGVIVATYGGKGSDLVAGAGPGALATVAGEVLQHACEIRIPVTSTGELEPLRADLPYAVWDSIEQHGLAAYLVAAPELERKLSTEVHAIGEPRCPEGAAVVYAAIDWALCGRTDPMARDTLRELWPSYLPAGARTTDADFERGLDWALRPVAGTIALLQGTGDYRPYDYVVRFVDDQPGTPSPPQVTWASVLKDVSAPQALAIGESAHDRGYLSASVAAFRVASRSSEDVPAVFGSFNLAISLGDLGKLLQALAAYGEIVARFGDASDLVLREHVARALVNRAATLVELDRCEEALAAYVDVVERFGEAPEVALREPVGKALLNRAATLSELGRSREELMAYEELLARFGDAPEAELRELVARTLFNKAFRLRELGRCDEALVLYEQLVARFGDASEPELRDQVGRALANTGTILGDLGRYDEAFAIYEDLLRRFGDAPERELREQVGQALLNKGTMLSTLGHGDDAIAVYEEVVGRLGDASEPSLCQHVAGALVNKATTLVDLDRCDEAVEVYEEVVERFGDGSGSMLRVPAARALVNKGITMGNLGRTDDELAAYDEVLERFGGEFEPTVLEQVARALVNKSTTLRDLGRWEEALDACEEVLEWVGDAPELELREPVAGALGNKAAMLVELGRGDESLVIYDELLERFGDATELDLREQVGETLVNKAAALVELDRCDEAFVAYDEVSARFGDAAELILREQVVLALACKSFALRGLGRSQEAIEVLRGMITWLGDTSEPSLIEASAAASKALTILAAD